MHFNHRYLEHPCWWPGDAKGNGIVFTTNIEAPAQIDRYFSLPEAFHHRYEMLCHCQVCLMAIYDMNKNSIQGGQVQIWKKNQLMWVIGEKKHIDSTWEFDLLYFYIVMIYIYNLNTTATTTANARNTWNLTKSDNKHSNIRYISRTNIILVITDFLVPSHGLPMLEWSYRTDLPRSVIFPVIRNSQTTSYLNNMRFALDKCHRDWTVRVSMKMQVHSLNIFQLPSSNSHAK